MFLNFTKSKTKKRSKCNKHFPHFRVFYVIFTKNILFYLFISQINSKKMIFLLYLTLLYLVLFFTLNFVSIAK